MPSKITTTLTVRIPNATAAELRNVAATFGVTVNEVVSQALERTYGTTKRGEA